jgi:hypothetical protein
MVIVRGRLEVEKVTLHFHFACLYLLEAVRFRIGDKVVKPHKVSPCHITLPFLPRTFYAI